MPRNASRRLSRVLTPEQYREQRDKAIALEYVRRGEGNIAPQMAREMGREHSLVYRAIRKYVEWAREELAKGDAA